MSFAYPNWCQDINKINERDKVSFRRGSHFSLMVFEGKRVSQDSRGFPELIYDFFEPAGEKYPEFSEGIIVRSLPRSRLYLGQGQLVLSRPLKGDAAAMSIVLLPEDGEPYERRKEILKMEGLM